MCSCSTHGELDLSLLGCTGKRVLVSRVQPPTPGVLSTGLLCSSVPSAVASVLTVSRHLFERWQPVVRGNKVEWARGTCRWWGPGESLNSRKGFEEQEFFYSPVKIQM